MYAISNDRNRRPGQEGQACHELPILFHLMDVSRPRSEAQDDQALAAVVEEPIAAVGLTTTGAPLPDIVPLTLPPIDSAPSPLAASLDTSAEPQPPAEPLAIVAPVLAKVAACVSASGEIASTTASQVESLRSDPAGDDSAGSDTLHSENTSAARPSPAVTLKSKTSERRKRKTPASEDWFAAHGKFIAIGFVVALIGTVYFARTTRQQAAPAKAGATGQSPLADGQMPDSPGAGQSSLLAGSGGAKAATSTSRVQTVSVVSDSKVELHPPTAPTLAGAAAEDRSPSADKLFDFPSSRKSDERVATRPEVTTRDSSRPSEPAARSKEFETVPTAGSPAAAPELAPVYPTTSSPAVGYPATAPPPSAYPATSAPPLMGAPAAVRAPLPQAGYPAAPQGPGAAPQNYRSQFPMPGTSPSQAWPPTGANVPGAYQPLENTARGQRNERTGSGNY